MAEVARILVIEDDAIIREILMTILQDEGYEVEAVRHGREALELLRGWPADLLILDLMLPIVDGWTFLNERRRLGLVLDAPVIVLSAARSAPHSVAANTSITAVIMKPFDLDNLIATVRHLLARRESAASPASPSH